MPVWVCLASAEECRVRQLLSARQLKMPSWKKHLVESNAVDAVGDEAYAYTYGSSGCSVEPVPNYFGVCDYLVLEQVRKKWRGKKFYHFANKLPHAANYKLGDYARAAIETINELAPTVASESGEK